MGRGSNFRALISGSLLLAWLWSLSGPVYANISCSDDTKDMVDRINERYDDFFRRQKDEERRNVQRERASQEVKKERQDHEKVLEQARRDYKRSKVVQDPRLEKEWNAQENAWKEQNRLAGLRCAERKKQVEALERRGRHIPDMKEYDLED